jgi:hypothetical protein
MPALETQGSFPAIEPWPSMLIVLGHYLNCIIVHLIKFNSLKYLYLLEPQILIPTNLQEGSLSTLLFKKHRFSIKEMPIGKPYSHHQSKYNDFTST